MIDFLISDMNVCMRLCCMDTQIEHAAFNVPGIATIHSVDERQHIGNNDKEKRRPVQETHRQTRENLGSWGSNCHFSGD